MADVPCGTCTACCEGPGRYLILDDKDDASQYETYTREDGKVCVAKKANDDCVYLGPNGCSIYERRPIVCREFDCRDWITHPKIAPKVKRAAIRIMFRP